MATTTPAAAQATMSSAAEEPAACSSTKATPLSPAKSKLTFFSLPPELRNEIYHLALSPCSTALLRLNDNLLYKGNICVNDDCVYNHCPRREGRARVCIACMRRLKFRLQAQTRQPALLQASRSIRAEATAVWLSYARWFVDSGYYIDVGSRATMALVVKWLRSMGVQRRAMLRGLFLYAFDEREAREMMEGAKGAGESEVGLERCKDVAESMSLSGEVFKVSFSKG